MADELNKIPGGPSRLSGFGAAYKAARAKYKESGGTDPYAKDAQFDYKGKDGISRSFNVAMAGEKRGAATKSEAPAKPGATSKPASELESNKRNPPAAPVVLGGRGKQSAAQYMANNAKDKVKDNYGEFSRAPLRFDVDAGLDAAGLAAMAYPPARAGLTALRGSRMAAAASGMGKRAMDAAPGMGKRAMDAAKNMFSRKKPDAGTGKVVSAEETIARVSAKPKKFSDLLPGQKKVEASTARKERYEADKAYRKDMVKKQGLAKKADTARKKGVVTEKEAADMADGYKKGGKVKAKPLPFWMKKKGAKPGDKAKAPMKFKEGGMVKGIDGCAQRGRTRA
jgi:hypothetical protein